MIRVRVANGENGVLEGLGFDPGSIQRDVDEHRLLWIDLDEPNPVDLNRVGQEFGLHPLAIEDAAVGHQRPKIDLYRDSIYVVFYVLELVGDEIRTRELSMFAGKDYLITVHSGPLPVIEETSARWNSTVLARDASAGVGLLVYSLLDSIVDGYFPVVDALADRLDELEGAIFSGEDKVTHAQLFEMKKQLLAVRRVLAPEREVLNVMIRRDAPLFNQTEITYFQDIYDHLLRITDAVDTYRDLLSSALDATMAMASFKLEDTVKRMTSASIILMSMALISGIYGMNFINMPELGWQWGYAWAIGLMVVLGGGLAWGLRRIDWL